ncbi:hypothetical protein OESDEN_02928 [Oesophagostomum dentatum]|uniref:Thioredoxin domain-containing protein n=1 Tax=Oesophagostomum dentatum TaxID=61180 RepID=A0A0B1THT6_OESDE|nr:hypothetical protein OESDEN_02928 [Oesophagostomum dentatum]
MRLLLLLFALTYFAYAQTRRRDNPLAKGFPTEIDWVDWSRAIRVAKSRNKPVFFLIHKSWCGACKNLKKEFETDPETPELIELSKKFVMVNVEDDDEPSEKEYRPDGAYIPRIIFLDTNGKHLQTNNAKLFRNHKFFYPLIPQIIDGMKRALDEFETVVGES